MNNLIKSKLELLPTSPGCYIHKDKNGTIIYVGKAKNLRNRVRSYFRGSHDTKTEALVSEIVDFEFIVTESNIEALLLEINLIKENKPMQRLMVAGAGCKLALSIATNTTVLCMLYGCMMGNYDGLYLPMLVLGYVFSVPFFLLTVRTSQKKGQKASLMRYVSVALVCYVGVLVLLMLWGKGDGFTLSIMGENGLALNLYTVLFILLFGVGYGAYYATADMPIPMVADCSDYETYQSGKYIPGIMGTLFSLVDKLVSSLSATVVGIAVTFIGLNNLPTQYDPYTPGMNVVVIVLFCAIPMVAWAATLIAMKGYSLTGEKMKEIQAVNACRRDAVAKGMKLEDAMDKWQTMEQLPAEYRS